MKADVFFCTCAKDPMRLGMAMAVLDRLKRDDAINLTVLRTQGAWLEPKDIPGASLFSTDHGFQRVRRKEAESLARTDPYFICDDDCMPLGDNFFERAQAVAKNYPQFAILAAWPITSSIQPWTPEGYEPFRDESVEEHVSVGGLYLIRAGIMNSFPSTDSRGYDAKQGEYIREKGLRVGFMRGVSINHFGEGYSSLWQPPSVVH